MDHFSVNPLRVVLYDPIGQSTRHIYCFVPWAPAAVVKAIRAGGTSDRDKAILKEHFGTSWKNKLCLDVKNPTTALLPTTISVDEYLGGDQDKELTGAAPSIFSDEMIGGNDVDDFESLLADAPRERVKSEIIDINPGVTHIFGTDSGGVAVYSQDKINELRNKIYLSIGIPAYRQHLFWFTKTQLRLPYRLHLGGPYLADIRTLDEAPDRVAGLPVDKKFYDARKEQIIEARDAFVLLEEVLPECVVYLVDLDPIFRDVSKRELNSDTYQFDLVYYGLIAKYWPQMTPEVFADYLRDENEMPHLYPALSPSRSHLSAAHQLERELIGQPKKVTETLTSAITQLVAFVHTRGVQLDLRNLFDVLQVSRCIPEICAYVQRDGHKYLLRKQHKGNAGIIPWPSGNFIRTGLTIAISMRRADQDRFHADVGNSTQENEHSRYLFLNIAQNGRYTIRTMWNEEDGMDFDKIVRVMKAFCDRIVDQINAGGRQLFISGMRLTGISKSTIKYQSMNASVFWKRLLLEPAYKLVRAEWDKYHRAGISAPKVVQQHDKYEFLFRKGMHEFDTTNINRILTASSVARVPNQYIYLSNAAIKQRWDQNFEGRTVKMTHRTTDVRFEVFDIREGEFATFLDHISQFATRCYAQDAIRNISTRRDYSQIRKLRKLREQDPALFNMKKYGSVKDYASICQKPRQPVIYTPDEIQRMSKAEQAKLTQYWNFTTQATAWYGCPNKKYPHLSFIVGVHPKHYCLPCCAKKRQEASSRKSRVVSSCLSAHIYTEDDQESAISRHVVHYGRELDVGRLSKLPPELAALLAGIGHKDQEFYLFGVPQNIPGVKRMGVLFSVAEALGLTYAVVVADLLVCAKKIVEMGMFDVLLSGAISQYFEANELLDVMRDVFHKMQWSPHHFDAWPELLVELLEMTYNCRIYTFIDVGADKDSKLMLHHIPSRGVYVPLPTNENEVRSVVIVATKGAYYPMFHIDISQYFRNASIKSRIYELGSPFETLLRDMVNAPDEYRTGAPLNDEIVKEFAQANKWKVEEQYVNRSNLCYQILLRRDDEAVLVPVDYSVVTKSTNFAPFLRSKHRINVKHVVDFVKKLNKYLTNTRYALIKFDAQVMSDTLVGLRAGDTIWYCTGTPDDKLPIEHNYDMDEVNALIIKHAAPTPDARSEKLGAALYDNYLYELYLLSFMNYIDKQRNVDMRRRIVELVQSTNFRKDIGPFKVALKQLLAKYPDDLLRLQGQLSEFYHTTQDKKALAAQIEDTIYSFDRQIITQLRELDLGEMRSRLMKISAEFCVERDLVVPEFPNTFTTCDEPQPYCAGAKLIVNKPLIGLVNLLCADLRDDLKYKYMVNGIHAESVIDYFKFTQRPIEVITIYRI